MLLTGTYLRTLDDKLRIPLPKPLRDALGAKSPQWLYVAPGTDSSLTLYTEEYLAQLAERLRQSSPTQVEVRAFNRLFYAQAQRAEIDSQSRIRIPAELAQMANLQREAVLLGVSDHLELWDKSRWDAYLAEKRPQYDQIAESAFSKNEQPR